MPHEVSGSRLPVGSSARKMRGRCTSARAIATRCCSPPLSSSGNLSSLSSRPTIQRTSSTFSRMWRWPGRVTWSAKATFWATVRRVEQLVVLEHDAELAPQLGELAVRHPAHLLPVDEDPSGRGRLVADQQAHQRRLAGAARADQEAEVALMDRQINVAQGLRTVRVDLAHAVKRDDRAQRVLRGGRRSSPQPPRSPGCPLGRCLHRLVSEIATGSAASIDRGSGGLPRYFTDWSLPYGIGRSGRPRFWTLARRPVQVSLDERVDVPVEHALGIAHLHARSGGP